MSSVLRARRGALRALRHVLLRLRLGRRRFHTGESWLRRLFLSLGIVFLYAPIVLLIIYSFNASERLTIWGGLSWRWYIKLFENPAMLSAAWNSFQVASVSASVATVLGTLAALSLTRLGPFRGRAFLSTMTVMPLVMPEIITGISLLLFFIALESWIGWPDGRGKLTIIIAHATFSIAFVCILVRARLFGLNTRLEDAARDLGAREGTVFFLITLPLLWPAILSGWLLAFTLSMDDLVIASFVSGPGSTTLPMRVYSSVRLGFTPEINALGTLLVLLVLLALLLG